MALGRSTAVGLEEGDLGMDYHTAVAHHMVAAVGSAKEDMAGERSWGGSCSRP